MVDQSVVKSHWDNLVDVPDINSESNKHVAALRETVEVYNNIAKLPDNTLTPINVNTSVEELKKAIANLPLAQQIQIMTNYNNVINGIEEKEKQNDKESDTDNSELRTYTLKTIITVVIVTCALVILLITYALTSGKDPAGTGEVLKKMLETASDVIELIIDGPGK